LQGRKDYKYWNQSDLWDQIGTPVLLLGFSPFIDNF